jgi:hypothetical protein
VTSHSKLFGGSTFHSSLTIKQFAMIRKLSICAMSPKTNIGVAISSFCAKMKNDNKKKKKIQEF